jgi:hypothetical protein
MKHNKRFVVQPVDFVGRMFYCVLDSKRGHKPVGRAYETQLGASRLANSKNRAKERVFSPA